jgi:hypothetical protein
MENCEYFGEFAKYLNKRDRNNVHNRAGHGSDETKNIKR